jgi:hypothetical protein
VVEEMAEVSIDPVTTPETEGAAESAYIVKI